MSSGSMFNLEGFLRSQEQELHLSLDSFDEWIRKKIPTKLADPIHYSLMSGGKRLRPILCVAAYRACGGTLLREVYDLAISVEVIHTYSLMHDDLPCMDDADLRRGRATPHRIFAEEDVLKAGVLLIPAASLWAVETSERWGLEDSIKKRIIHELNKASGSAGMVGGQYLDLLAEKEVLSHEALEVLHQKKTGALLSASVTIGALAANADNRLCEHLGRFGHWLGLSFQIKDDLLDATATAKDLGKHPSDGVHSKSTYVSLHGVEVASQMATAMKDRALESIAKAGINDPWLIELAEYALNRTK
jgi:geranylgeranyl diphosphate synthase type II